MTDLVAELRTWEAAPNVRGEVRSIAKKSADEIARLTRDLADARAEVVRLNKYNKGLDEIQRQLAEVPTKPLESSSVGKDRKIARLMAALSSAADAMLDWHLLDNDARDTATNAARGASRAYEQRGTAKEG